MTTSGPRNPTTPKPSKETLNPDIVERVGEAALMISNLSKCTVAFAPDTLGNIVRDKLGVTLSPEHIEGVVLLVRACTARNGGASRTKPITRPTYDKLMELDRKAPAPKEKDKTPAG